MSVTPLYPTQTKYCPQRIQIQQTDPPKWRVFSCPHNGYLKYPTKLFKQSDRVKTGCFVCNNPTTLRCAAPRLFDDGKTSRQSSVINHTERHNMTPTQNEQLRELAAELLEHLDGTQTHDPVTERAYLARLIGEMASMTGKS